MSAVFRRPDTMVAAAAQSRARTPGTSSTAGVGVFVAEEWIRKFLRCRESPTESS